MKILQYKCDIDGKECDVREMSVFSGSVAKMTAELETQRGIFEYHLCNSCTDKLLVFIDKLKDGKV